MIEQTGLAARIARQIERRAGLFVDVREQGGTVVLEGRVESAEARRLAERIALGVAPDRRIRNELEARPDLLDAAIRALPPDADAAGQELVASFAAEIPEEESEQFAPTDPVVTLDAHGRLEILGGFSQTSMDSLEVEASAEDSLPGDEALAEAIRRELREDAETTDLSIQVTVRQGVAHLRGAVPSLLDAENAEEVAARIPGVREVVEELEV